MTVSKIQEQLGALNRKLDLILSRIPQGNSPGQTPQLKVPNPKPTYQAICADCKKECHVPFKPTGDRPVYCKECFACRRNGSAKTHIVPAIAVPVEEKKETRKAAATKKKAAKRPASKKKVAAKKKGK